MLTIKGNPQTTPSETVSFKKVFREDSLREKILRYVIHTSNGNGTFSSSICSCRLVNKSWNTTITKVLRKCRTPLFYISLYGNYFQSDSYHGQRLCQFLSEVLSPSHHDRHIPSFSFDAFEDFFIEENYQSFLTCLRNYGNSVSDLGVTFPLNGGSMPLIFPPLSFKRLKKFCVAFTEYRKTDVGEPLVGNTAIVPHFIQSVFEGCHELKEFEIEFVYVNGKSLVPFGFEYLKLPTTLTSVDFSCEMNSKHLKVLLRNPLPKLQVLSLLTSFTQFEIGLIFKILKHVSKTLKFFGVEGIAHDGTRKTPTLFRFPLMEKLEICHILSTHCELEPKLLALQHNLPKLNTLVLEDQSVQMFKKWTKKSVFKDVTDLRVSLINSRFAHSHPNFDVTFNAEILQRIDMSFPNIKTLELTLCGTEMSGLQYLFLEMRHIQTLSLMVKRNESIVNSDFWDALLIGIPVEWATALRTTPSFWDCLDLKDNKRPSIKNLIVLKDLYLKSEDSTATLAHGSLISGAAFHFAFLKMTSLKKLWLYRRFSISQELAQKWKNAGRSLHCEM